MFSTLEFQAHAPKQVLLSDTMSAAPIATGSIYQGYFLKALFKGLTTSTVAEIYKMERTFKEADMV
jgi:hypothetical protein